MTVAAAPDREPAGQARPKLDFRTAARNFREVVAQVEPVAEALCREELFDDPDHPCDVRVGIDSRVDMPPNAFLTIDKAGRPTILFTMRLIEVARSQDELAFVFGHEMGHLLGKHVQKVMDGRATQAAMAGTATDTCGVVQAGGGPGTWMVLHEFELEADRIGAAVAERAGYDPVSGVRIIGRLQAGRGGDACPARTGTYPDTADRIEAVRAASRAL